MFPLMGFGSVGMPLGPRSTSSSPISTCTPFAFFAADGEATMKEFRMEIGWERWEVEGKGEEREGVLEEERKGFGRTVRRWRFHQLAAETSFGALGEDEPWEKMEKTKAIFLLLLHCSLLSSTSGFSSGPVPGHTINGRVKIEGVGAKGIGVGWKTSNVKIILNGGESVTFVRPDGYFSFHNVPAGTHLIEVAAMGYFFSPVRVDVSARNRGKVQAALTETRRGLSELVLEPLREEQYYEIREPFSAMSLLKSPMGLMLGFMVLVMFVMPKLVDGMDPEEIKRAQEEMRQGVPSLSNLLPRSN